MPLLQLSAVSLAYGHVPLLDRVDLVIEPGRRIGLIGRNGTGKSSMLRIISGEAKPDDGTVWRTPGLKLASVPQEPRFASGQTVFEAVAEGLGESRDLLLEYHAVTHAMALSHNDSVHDDPALMQRLNALQTQLEDRDGWTLQHRVESTLSRLSLPEDLAVDDLSGGTRKRVALARALVLEPDLLVLDEPTNHLDIAAIEWLEETLRSFAGSVLCVTHDRRFLDDVVDEILELDRGLLTGYPGNFSVWQARKAEALAAEAQQNRKFDKVLAQEEVWIRKGIEARRTRNEGRVRRLESLRLERAARRDRAGRVELALGEGERSGRLVVELEHVSQSYDGGPVVKDFSCRILRGDKVGLIGANGTGKTTLLKLFMGDLQPDKGKARLGSKLELAYFDQFRAALNEEATLGDTISQGGDYVEINGARKHVISYLGDFLFPPERVRALVKSLSGGERNRLLLARLFSRPANVLVLDEPTNDLDIETLELLEELLQDYSGTLFLVSHDRAFLDNVVTQTIASEGEGRWKEYAGGDNDWLRASRASAKAEPKPAAAREEFKTAAGQDAAPRAAKAKLSYKERRALAELPLMIEALEKEQAAIAAALADGAVYRDDPKRAQSMNQRHAAIEVELEAALERLVALEAK
ncbi:MAG: ABC transporter ATP-binding protein [Gammaproteobacteria bacterium RIFCSPLOWO2_02_FULL_61_13]|nr:MAG: ABC transporter ATP-binding protein [Gammaproteobacteria bacterium RIFCSPLOWO2_02_FULL_61_13]